jgi:predicted nucleic acid-binding protein
VLDETFTLLGRWAGYAFAAQRAKIILSSSAITILRPNEHDEIEAVDLFEKFADQRVSYTDCISFVLMRLNKIEQVFAFDRHFERAGFQIIP